MSLGRELHSQLSEKLREWVQVKNSKQVINWIGIVAGILQSESCHLNQIANDLPMKTWVESRVTLFRRWLMNTLVNVWSFYRKVLEPVFTAWSNMSVTIILDGVRHSETLIYSTAWRNCGPSLNAGWKSTTPFIPTTPERADRPVNLHFRMPESLYLSLV
jgi:hypothetical protein